MTVTELERLNADTEAAEVLIPGRVFHWVIVLETKDQVVG